MNDLTIDHGLSGYLFAVTKLFTLPLTTEQCPVNFYEDGRKYCLVFENVDTACYQDSQPVGEPSQTRAPALLRTLTATADTPKPHTHKQTYTDTYPDTRTYCIH